MLCLKQWQHSSERDDKEEVRTEINKVLRTKDRNTLRTARAGFGAPAECVCVAVLITVWGQKYVNTIIF